MLRIITIGLMASVTLVATAQDNAQPDRYIPDFIVAQYAGSVGVVAAGAGYGIFKNKASIDLSKSWS